MFQNTTKIQIRDMWEKGKTWMVSEMVSGVFIENERSFTVLILENK